MTRPNDEWAAPGRAREDRRLAKELARRSGMTIHSIYDLVNGPTPPEMIPLLVEALRDARHPAVLEGVLRALSVREARGVANVPVIELLRRTSDPYLRTVAATTLTTIAQRSDFEDLARSLEAEDDPGVRAMLVRAIAQTGEPLVVGLLMTMLDDSALVAVVAAELLEIDTDRALAALPRLDEVAETGGPTAISARRVAARIRRRCSQSRASGRL